jgi:hypothetical protein
LLRQGSWVPAVSLGALLTTIRLLLATPNPDDGLMPDIVRALFCGDWLRNALDEWCRCGCSVCRVISTRRPNQSLWSALARGRSGMRVQGPPQQRLQLLSVPRLQQPQ